MLPAGLRRVNSGASVRASAVMAPSKPCGLSRSLTTLSRCALAMGASLSALPDLIHDGKVRAIGSSTFPAEQIVEAQWVAQDRGYARFCCEQPP